MEKLRVLLVDDHPIIIEAVPVLLKSYPDIEIVGVAKDGKEGLDEFRRLHPDCIVVDLAMPKLGGIETICICLQEKPDLLVVVYTGHMEETLVYEALQAGAKAYVLKGSPVSVLVSALREVKNGGYWLSTELNPMIVRRYLNRQGCKIDRFSEYNMLSNREKQVFMLLAKGKTPKEIGKTLFISVKTVSKHQTAIKAKLKVKNAAEMAIYALSIGACEQRVS